MTDNKPLVSIGMPVYNAERYIRQALDSLLAQDYKNFELIISDNASTDHTPEICQGYVARDKRIRYYRNKMNLGSFRNFNRVAELSSGKYIMFAAYDDLWDSTFISRCVPILEENPEVVLVYSQAVLIGPDGSQIGLRNNPIDTRGMSAVHRYKHVLWNPWCFMVYGVIRRETLSQTGILRNVWGSAFVTLVELALKGEFAQIGEPLFYYRKSRPEKGFDESEKKRYLFDHEPMTATERSKKTHEDLNRELRDSYLKILAHAPIGFLEKLEATILTIIHFRHIHGVRVRSLIFLEWLAIHAIPRKLRHTLQYKMISWRKPK